MRPLLHRVPYPGYFLVGLILLILAPFPSLAANVETPGRDQAGTVVTLFWGEGCPHCEKEKEFLNGLVRKHPGLTVKDYEVWRNK
jgi:thiol-disulfide isomerase/thioredoxin